MPMPDEMCTGCCCIFSSLPAPTKLTASYITPIGDEDGEEDDEEEEPEPVFIPKKKKFKGYKKYAGRSLRKCDPYDLEDVIVEVVNLGEGALACPIRNESQMMKLRDDHQLNLRMIKKQIQEERRGLAPTLSVCLYAVLHIRCVAYSICV